MFPKNPILYLTATILMVFLIPLGAWGAGSGVGFAAAVGAKTGFTMTELGSAETGIAPDLLGSVWDESENGWTGTWTRRGASNVFDAVWTNGGGKVTAVLTMTQTGANTVSIYRRDTSSNNGVMLEFDYKAAISGDGSVSGSATIRGSGYSYSGYTYSWQGKIRKAIPPPNEEILGSYWEESENGWGGTWTRRGASNVFDAVWTKGYERVTAILTMTQTGANTVSIYRQDTSSTGAMIEVDYTATINKDGMVSGRAIQRGTGYTYSWWARIRTAPPIMTDILGSIWEQNENGWTGVWTRRGASNVFDAVWTNGGGKVTAVLTMTQTSVNTVSIYRQDNSSTGSMIEVDYRAIVNSDGTMTGTGTVRGSGITYPWQATTRMAPPTFSDIIGAVWEENENGWGGTWTRRGASNVFDAVWTKGYERVTAVLMMTQTGVNTVSIYRQDTSSTGSMIEVDYTATIDKDGRVSGKAIQRGNGYTYSWWARIRTAPPSFTDILGSIWEQSENGWTEVWTRRGASNVFDAVWTNGGGKVTAVLTMTQTGANTVLIYRHDTSSTGSMIDVDYTAIISSEGSVSGSATIRGSGATYLWQAKIR